ncbi:MAG: OmpA family protein [Cytophagaceae bacterium]
MSLLKPMKHLLLLFLGLSLAFSGQSQNKNQPKLNPKTVESEARELFRIDEYRQALPLYLKLDSIKPENPSVNCRIGICYLHTENKSKALPYLVKAQKLGYTKDHISFHLAVAYHLNHEFDKAIEYYKASHGHFNPKKDDDVVKLKKLPRYIEMCENGKELVKKPVDVKIENLGPVVNSEFPEYAPVISADETVLIFTSRRPNTTGGKKEENGQWFEDIYISTRDSLNGSWSKPENIAYINTAGHDASIGLSPDGQELFIYKDEGNGDIFVSVLEGNKWSEPKKIPGGINSKFHEPSATTSADEKVLFFTSDRDGGFGGYDIYMTKMLPNGQWALPKNLGPKVNTPYDEDAPFFHPDGKTLYFSSTGHNSMGGYDIFTTEVDLEADTFSKPVNIGYPINTADNDIFFVWSADGTRGYFSSYREGGFGEKDIWVVSRPKPKVSLIVLKGKVFSKPNLVPVAATITVVDNETNKVVGVYTSNSFTGKYTIIVPPGKNYGISVEADRFLAYSENVDIPQKDDYFEVTKDIILEPLEKGSVTVLKNVFFDFAKADLRKESYGELDRFYKMLKENPTLCVEIAGHTDDVGNSESNQKLSEARAQSVVKYLVDKGIDEKRLLGVGYGEEFPVATNSTDEGRQLNRRTELIIVETLTESMAWKEKETFYFNKQKEQDQKLLHTALKDEKLGLILPDSILNKLDYIYFDFDKSVLRDEARQSLEQWIKLLKANKDVKLELHGHTDSMGDKAYNKALAQRRINSVKNYLVAKGIIASRFRTTNFGADKPDDTNDTEVGRQRNRRVEIKIIK